MPDSDRELAHRLEAFLESGADMAGSVASTGIGLLVGGVEGAFVGAASGPVIVQTLRSGAVDFVQRTMSRREQAKVSGALLFAVERIQYRLEAGHVLRNDGFFSIPQDSSRSAADEVAEGVLLTAQRQHQERKIRHLGYMLANIAFDPTIDVGWANFLIRMVDRLSYRQLCLLAMVGHSDRGTLPEMMVPDHDTLSYAFLVFMRELRELEEDRIIVFSGHKDNDDRRQWFDNRDMKSVKPAMLGWTLYRTLELDLVDREDIQSMRDAFTDGI